MNSIATCSQSELTRAALHSPARSVFPSNYRVREIASDVALVVAVLAFVLSFVALRMTLYVPADVERAAMPVATGGAAVFVLALLGALVLRHKDAPGPNR
jgi:hypothetical protein